MGLRTTLVDYFEDEADLEASVDLPVLGHLTWESRFHQLQDGLNGLAPDPHLAERLYQFVRSDVPVVWVIGLGDGGEEVPVAVGLAERAALDRGQPVLLAGPERRRPRGLGASGLRPIDPGPFEPALAALYPEACGAQASGIQGVLRVWPGFDEGVQPIAPGGLVIAGRATSEGLVPPQGVVSSALIVVPFRDQPAQIIVEEVTRLRAMGYPLLGVVAVSARAVERRVRATTEEMPEPAGERLPTAQVGSQGGTMEGAAGDRERAGEPFDDGRDQADEVFDAQEPVDSQDQDDDDAFPAGRGSGPLDAADRRPASWAEAFVPGARAAGRRTGGRVPWWGWVAGLIAVGALAILASRLIAVEGGRPQQAARVRPTPTRTAVPPAASTPRAEAPSAATPARPGGAAAGTAEGVTGPSAASASSAGGVPASAPQAAEPVAPPVSEPVAQQVAPRAPSAGASPPPAAATGRSEPPFGLMCGSFRTASRAQGEATRLAGVGLEARVVAVEIPGKGTWHRVVAGSWPDLAQARAAGRRALSAGWVKDAMIVSQDGYGPPMPGRWE